MALDGIVLASLVHELKQNLIGGRIDKIYQIEKEDLLMGVRSSGKAQKVLLTANSSYPRLHLSTLSKNPSNEPPMFCMLLRKHISGGKILDIAQHELERIVTFSIEATNELGDKEVKKLIIEIMGRHSNIILTNSENLIIDSIKHISLDKSSVREVLPNRTYVLPPSQEKLSPLNLSEQAFKHKLSEASLPLFKALYTSFSGLSPLIAEEICYKAHLDADKLLTNASDSELTVLYQAFNTIFRQVSAYEFSPTLYLDEKELPMDFYSLPLTIYSEKKCKQSTSISELVEYYYHDKSTRFNVGQKTSDIKKLLHTFIDRSVRKKQIQEAALEEAAQKDQYKIYGELLTAYAHQVPSKAKTFTTLNYYTEPYEEISIPLKEHKTAIENAQAYFKLYSKAKRTETAALNQLAVIEEDLSYLQSVLVSLDFLETAEDISELRAELIEMGYLKKRKGLAKNKKPKKTIPFLQFKSSKGHPIYVGKNNYQNDELTIKFAKNGDLWLHIKDGPGSHVIVKAVEGLPIDDEVVFEAATLAAYYSSGKMSSHVPIDYTDKRFVKKVPNAKPGMVIYTQFKTIYITPEEAFVKKLNI